MPPRRPMTEKRPLSSVVAVKLLGDAFGFSAVTVAPFIGLTAFVLDSAADAPGLGGGHAAHRGDERPPQVQIGSNEDGDAC